jgi:hypothetical protein
MVYLHGQRMDEMQRKDVLASVFVHTQLCRQARFDAPLLENNLLPVCVRREEERSIQLRSKGKVERNGENVRLGTGLRRNELLEVTDGVLRAARSEWRCRMSASSCKKRRKNIDELALDANCVQRKNQPERERKRGARDAPLFPRRSFAMTSIKAMLLDGGREGGKDEEGRSTRKSWERRGRR